MIDLYTKFVLSVIAVALLALAALQAIPRWQIWTAQGPTAQISTAQSAVSPCGATNQNPCYVKMSDPCWSNGPCLLNGL
jgi:hypothetical protein